MIMVLGQIADAIDNHPGLVDLSNSCHPLFIYDYRKQNISGQQFAGNTLQEEQNCKNLDNLNPERHATIKVPLSLYHQLEFLKGKVPHQAFVMALLYIDRASQINKTLLINSKNVIKIAVASILIASKFIESEDCSPKQLRKIRREHYHSKNSNILVVQIGIQNQHLLKEIEIQMFALMGFQAYISKEEYDNYQKQLNELYSTQMQEIHSSYQIIQKKERSPKKNQNILRF